MSNKVIISEGYSIMNDENTKIVFCDCYSHLLHLFFSEEEGQLESVEISFWQDSHQDLRRFEFKKFWYRISDAIHFLFKGPPYRDMVSLSPSKIRALGKLFLEKTEYLER